jgi:hypothetical protein
MKSTISDLGYGDRVLLGLQHARGIAKEKTELILKIEPHLNYLDYHTLKWKGANVQAKVDTLKQQRRHSDQLKEDALATLSDQGLKLMVEVQDMKKQRKLI